MELYKKYRPKTLADVVGQDGAVKVLRQFIKSGTTPHSLLLTGPSGCGKTTLARILKSELNCSDVDFCEINAADSRGIDTVRDIRNNMGLAPMLGDCRMYLLDECHQLSRKSGGDAQTALLKMLEDTPSHVYFLLCTTDPHDLLKTIRTRCTEIKLGLLPAKQMTQLLVKVIQAECEPKSYPPDEVIDKIVEVSAGSAREALVILHQIIGLKNADDQMEAIHKAESTAAAIDLARVLMNTKSTWPDVTKILKSLDEEPETIRRIVLGYANSVLLGGGRMAQRAYLIISAMEDNYYSGGKASLTADCWEIIGTK